MGVKDKEKKGEEDFRERLAESVLEGEICRVAKLKKRSMVVTGFPVLDS